MDTTIITTLPSTTPVLTSSLPTIEARTSKVRIPVEVTRDPDGDNDTIFTTSLYAYDETVRLGDLGALIEERFRTAGRITDTVEVKFDGVALRFTALYCEYALHSDFDPTKCFLSATEQSVVHPASTIALTHIADSADPYRIKIIGLDPDGNTVATERSVTRLPAQSGQVEFTVAEIMRLAFTSSGVSFSRIAYFAITLGSMQKIFYIVDHPFFLTFSFRNFFNACEYLDVACVVTRKTVFDRDTTVCSGIVKLYNQSVQQTYEVHTAPLTPQQALEVEQLVGSRDVKLRAADGRLYDIIITDHTLEVDNDDEALPSSKFTFRFSHQRPRLYGDDMTALMPSSANIFSEQFTSEFS